MDRDPTPGDPDEVRTLADELQTFADDVGEALGRIRGMAEDRAVLEWAGLSAEAFRSEFDGVPGNLQKLQTSYDMAAQALQTYWPKLETAQGMADRALDRAISAQADLSTAQAALADAQDWVSRAGDEAERLEEQSDRENVEPPSEAEVRAATRDATAANEAASSAQSRVDSAEEALSAARQLALDAKEMREEAARTCASEIDAASDAGIQNRRWWEDAIHWVSENWDTIVEICKVVVAVLGIVVMIIGGPLAWVVLAAALVVLADTLYDYANGRATLWDVAFAALDCIPGMKGLTTLGGLARGLRGGLAAARTGLQGLRQGVRGLGQALRGLARRADGRVCPTDPIDMATGEMFMTAVDVELPGVLPLVIARFHSSTLRTGRWFGPSWVSTLDQRLVLGDDGVRFVTDDGMVLEYPRPLGDPDVPVLPVEGPRWGLSWDGVPNSPLTIHQPETGRTLHFAPVAGRPATELPLTAIADRNDNRVHFAYDDTGAPHEVFHDGGYRLAVETDGSHVTALSLISAPDEPVLLRYGYDERGNLTAVTDSSGIPSQLFYDDRHRVIGWEDRNGAWYRYRYDDAGRCVATEGVDGILSSSIVYEPESGRTRFTNALGHTTVYEFNDSYQPVAETDPLGNVVRTAWDRYDRPTSVTDPLGRTTGYEYDDAGRLVRTVYPDGSEQLAAYDERGLLVRQTGPDGSEWRYDYDQRGNQTEVHDPAGTRLAFSYGPRGELLSITGRSGATTRVESDPRGLPVAAHSDQGSTTTVRRDAFGRAVAATDPLGRTTSTTWTLEGRRSSRTSPDGTTETWTWDGEGNLLSHTNGTGATTSFTYTAFHKVATRTDATGGRIQYRFDRELNLTEVVNALGHSWRYVYDPAGRLVEETDFAGRILRYAYDPAGRRLSSINGAGETTTFVRDALGNVIEKNCGGSRTTFRYDRAGRLTTASGPDVEIAYERDALGRIVRESLNGLSTGFAYDDAGRRTQRTTPGGAVTAWSYTPEGVPTELHAADHSIRFAHDSAGQETRRDLGAGLALHHTWDEASRLVAQRLTRSTAAAPGGAALAGRDYRYATGSPNPDLVDDLLLGTEELGLDDNGRITAVHGNDRDEHYTYDAAGNLATASTPGDPEPAALTYAGSRLTSAGRRSYRYDDQGRVVHLTQRTLSGKRKVWHYGWDAEDRLVTVATPGGDHWHYTYDPFGRRIGKQRIDSSGRTVERFTFVWDGDNLAEQHHEAGDRVTHTTWEYEPGSHRVLTQEQRGWLKDAPQDEIDRRFHHIVTDLVGTPTEFLTPDGEVAWRRRTTLWGAPLGPTEGDFPLRFPGQYHDPETGLHYNRHRYYDPATARYLSPDPLGLTPAPDPYAYAPNPYTWSDPLGLTCRPRFVGLQWLTDRQLGVGGARGQISFRYQQHVTGQAYEQVWELADGRRVHVDGGPANGWITEAKWTQSEGQWDASPYNPDHHLFSETKQENLVDQAERLLELNDGIGGNGVRYAVSNLEGAQYFQNLFAGNERLAEAMASGRLGVFHVPANGMWG
ncbi:RHS repeat-associated core domain-containing protein [Streptomyces millisiae]|uniref:RHS repeat-associated core domain-containing protein n=1 Tax=Streptomyces millisiae TaxID=3075542 RepID=A0ABU2LLL5_9ACTN|nr:RHS repeat-associated core domain-containing protein [Streptomyces sp. DSM 44918]MDT0318479.1 RHS repeat-associated core domain-containing protein [Streptomyces sp. DSM 44918]